MSSELALRIRHLLDYQNLSIQGLEKKAGLKVNAVRNILSGNSRRPNAELLLSISKVLGCSIEELLGEERPLKNLEAFSEKDYSNYQLVLECLTFIVTFYERENLKLSDLVLLKMTRELYEFSQKNNHSLFDKDFAQWFLSRELPSK